MSGFIEWQRDKRFAHEHRMVWGALFVLVVLGLIFLGLFFLWPMPKPEAAIDSWPGPGVAATLPSPEPQAESTDLEIAAEHILAGQYDEADQVLNAHQLEIFRLRGVIAWKRGDLDAASVHFREAVEIDPQSVPDLCNLAAVRLQKNEVQGAVENLRQAHALSPADIFISNRLLLARIQLGETEAVATEVSTALQTAPEASLPSVATAAAAVELARGNPEQAAQFLHAAKGCLPPEIFESLLVEVPLASFAAEKALAPFFHTQTEPQ